MGGIVGQPIWRSRTTETVVEGEFDGGEGRVSLSGTLSGASFAKKIAT